MGDLDPNAIIDSLLERHQGAMTKQEYKSAADEIRVIREIAYGEGYQAGQQAMRKRAADVTELWDRMPVKVQDGFFEQFDNPRDIFEQGEIEACTSVQYGILALPIEDANEKR